MGSFPRRCAPLRMAELAGAGREAFPRSVSLDAQHCGQALPGAKMKLPRGQSRPEVGQPTRTCPDGAL